jgi:Serpentine type 7TM GPCR chemoreceptor Str
MGDNNTCVTSAHYFLWLLFHYCSDNRAAPLVHIYLFLIPGLIGTVTVVLSVLNADLSDEVFSNASTVLAPDELRTLVAYADARIPSLVNSLAEMFSLAACIYTYTAVVFFSVRIRSRLRASVEMLAADSRLREVNRQLNRVLATQALVPLVFAILPPILISVAHRIATISNSTKAFLGLWMSLQPVVNGLVTLAVVKPYRQAIAKALRGRGFGSVSTHATAVRAIAVEG